MDRELRAKLRKVETLLAGAATLGERAAAGAAAERIRQRLNGRPAEPPPEHFKFTVADPWSRHLFVALCRRHGLRPFRQRRMHSQTVLVEAPARLVEEVLWPEFESLNAALMSCLADVTARLIEEEIDAAGTEEPARRIAGLR